MKTSADASLLAKIRKQFPRFAEKLPHTESYFRPLAKLVLDSDRIFERRNDSWKYKSLADFGTENFIQNASFFGTTENEIFETLAIEYAQSLYSWLYYHEEGLCFFEGRSSGEFRLIEEGNADLDFALRLAREGLIPSKCVEAPEWMDRLFLYKPNVDAYKIFWFAEESARDDVLQARRRELRRLAVLRESGLAANTENDSAPTSKTPEQLEILLTENARLKSLLPPRQEWLMEIAIATQRRYWGKNWDPENPDTRTSQEKILEWLESEYRHLNLSEKQRIAIELVACPFNRNPRQR